MQSAAARPHPRRLLVGVAVAAMAVASMIATVGPIAPAGADVNEVPGSPLSARSITAGQSHSCALDDDGGVRCWGFNAYGQLGDDYPTGRGAAADQMGDNLPAIDLGTGRTATAVTAGRQTTCAILDDGRVKCWGRNADGELGIGDTNARGTWSGHMGDNLPFVDLGTGHTATAISVGESHTCAVLDDASVKCWGDGANGRLGYGDTIDRGDGPGEMGDNLPVVDLGTGRTATAITAGWFHTCALLDNGQVKCWGRNGDGVLGYGDANDRGDGPGEMGDDLDPVDLGTGRTATAISTSQWHTCALLDNGSITCWGMGFFGQLGRAGVAVIGDGPGEMGDDLVPVDLGSGRIATGVTVGDNHTCALLDNGAMKCWGGNSAGQLGLGDTAGRSDGPGEMGDALPTVDLGTGRTAVAVTVGERHTCAILDDGSAKCWGDNTTGQLGQGDQNGRGDALGEMGDALLPIDIPLMTRALPPAPAPDPTPTPDPDPPALAPGPTGTCMGRDATIVGRPDQRRIVGTSDDDVIVTRNPDGVTIAGRGGDDIICGGPGDDTISGGSGNDVISGRGGDDYLGGTKGDDTIHGGAGNDRLFGRAGNDQLFGMGGDDFLGGARGADLLHGGAGADQLFGRLGNDRLDGGSGPDTCHGGPGRNRTTRCDTTR